MINRKVALGVSIALALSALSVSAHAQVTNLVTNGNFDQTTAGTGMLDFNTVLTGWANSTASGANGTRQAYNFVYEPGSADTTGANGWDGNVKLWGPNTGSNNGLSDSPTGGNYIAADGAYYQGAITQTVSGLTPGQQYVLSFDWAAAQQSGFDGANWSQWNVTFGGESFSTAVLDNPSHGFTGWEKASYTFTASSNTQMLSFLAAGGPQGLPPFALLDGVTLTTSTPPVPEPEEWAMMLVGTGLVSLQVKRRKAKASKAA